MYRNVLRTWKPEPWRLEARTWKKHLETRKWMPTASWRIMSNCLAWRWTWRCFAFFVFVLFYVIQVKRQKKWLLFWNKDIVSFCRVLFCAIKMKESAPEIVLDLFQNCDFPDFDAVTMSLVGLATILDCRPSFVFIRIRNTKPWNHHHSAPLFCGLKLW